MKFMSIHLSGYINQSLILFNNLYPLSRGNGSIEWYASKGNSGKNIIYPDYGRKSISPTFDPKVLQMDKCPMVFVGFLKNSVFCWCDECI